MTAKRPLIIALSAIAILIAVGALIVANLIFGVLSNTNISQNTHYTEPSTAKKVALNENASDGVITITAHGVSDGTDPRMRDLWVKLNYFKGTSRFTTWYPLPLTPPDGSKYLVSNVTITNLRNNEVPFHYEDITLVGSDGNVYYANYALCSENLIKDVVKHQVLSADFSDNVYVLYSVPDNVNAQKIVYTSSTPPIVIDLI